MTALIYKTVAEMIDQAGLSPHAVLTDILITRHDEPLTRAVSCKMKATTRQRRPLQTTRRTTSPTRPRVSGPGARDASGGKRRPSGRKL